MSYMSYISLNMIHYLASFGKRFYNEALKKGAHHPDEKSRPVRRLCSIFINIRVRMPQRILCHSFLQL